MLMLLCSMLSSCNLTYCYSMEWNSTTETYTSYMVCWCHLHSPSDGSCSMNGSDYEPPDQTKNAEERRRRFRELETSSRDGTINVTICDDLLWGRSWELWSVYHWWEPPERIPFPLPCCYGDHCGQWQVWVVHGFTSNFITTNYGSIPSLGPFMICMWLTYNLHVTCT